MRLYDGGRAPNPRRVRIFLAEKGMSVPIERVDLAALEHKSAEFTALNPLQRVPVLVLDDGTVITESIAICRYIEGLRPEPPLFGRGALEIALTEMWNRRVELNLYQAVSAVFRHTHPAMKDLESQVPEWGEGNEPAARARFPRAARSRAAQPHVHRGRPLHRRRHHDAGGGRVDASGQAHRTGGARQPAPLACPDRRTDELFSVKDLGVTMRA